MSQSINIVGIYRNNKRNVVGLHNPKNNRVANPEEIDHLISMRDKYITPNIPKFKRIHYVVYLQNNERHEMANLRECLRIISTDV